ncbi:MAG: ABC transporter substrate-binding protein [Clostridium sp.]
MKLKKILSLTLAGVLATSILAGCGGKDEFQKAAEAKIFRTSGGYEVPETLHANAVAPPGVGNLGDYMHERLFDYVPLPDKTFIPVLGTEIVEEGKTTTIKLRKGVKWFDGTEFTAKDVVSQLNISFITGSVIWDYLDKIEAVDDHTVKATWKATNDITTELFASMVMNAPYHKYQKWSDQAAEVIASRTYGEDGKISKETKDKISVIRDDLYAWKPPVEESQGTGPFKLKNVTTSEAVLEKNTDYWTADNIKFEQVKIVRFTSLESYLNLVKGDGFDMETQGMSPDVYKEVIEKNDVKVILGADLGQPSLQFNSMMAPLDDVNVRKGIHHLIDRDTLKLIAEPGSEDADMTSSGLVPTMRDKFLSKDFQKTLEVYEGDKAKAEDYFKKAGWTKGSDGKWLGKDGKPVQLEIATTNAYPTFFLCADAVANQLNEFGITTQLKSVESSAYWKYVSDGDAMMSISMRPGSPNYGNPWEVYRSFFLDGAIDMGLAKSEEKKAGLTSLNLKMLDGSTKDMLPVVNELLTTDNEARRIELTEYLAKTVNELSLFMPLVTKYIPNKVFNENLTGYPEDPNDTLWYGAATQRVYVRLMREGKLYYKDAQ